MCVVVLSEWVPAAGTVSLFAALLFLPQDPEFILTVQMGLQEGWVLTPCF